MTIAEVSGFENEYSGTKNRLPEYLGTPQDFDIIGHLQNGPFMVSS
jgi:hypothetical protein